MYSHLSLCGGREPEAGLGMGSAFLCGSKFSLLLFDLGLVT